METGMPKRSLSKRVSGTSRVSSKLKIVALVPKCELTRNIEIDARYFAGVLTLKL